MKDAPRGLLLDHLVFGVPDLEAGAAWVEERLGLRLTTGGRHPGWGTANRLLGLTLPDGPGAYFEVIGPDPESRVAPGTRLPFGVGELKQPRLCTWAARTSDIDALVRDSRAAGYDPGPVQAMSRKRPDGSEISWRLALPEDLEVRHAGLVPFVLDWGRTPHPSAQVLAGQREGALRLLRLRAETPEPDLLRADLSALGLRDLDGLLVISQSTGARLVAELEGPNGRLELS